MHSKPSQNTHTPKYNHSHAPTQTHTHAHMNFSVPVCYEWFSFHSGKDNSLMKNANYVFGDLIKT